MVVSAGAPAGSRGRYKRRNSQRLVDRRYKCPVRGWVIRRRPPKTPLAVLVEEERLSRGELPKPVAFSSDLSPVSAINFTSESNCLGHPFQGPQ